MRSKSSADSEFNFSCVDICKLPQVGRSDYQMVMNKTGKNGVKTFFGLGKNGIKNGKAIDFGR